MLPVKSRCLITIPTLIDLQGITKDVKISPNIFNDFYISSLVKATLMLEN